MGNMFDLSALIPEPLTFRDVIGCEPCEGTGQADGAPCEKCKGRGKVAGLRYDAKTASDLGAIEYAKYARLMTEADQARRVLSSGKGDMDTAAATLESALNTLIGTLVPDLPSDRLPKISMQHKAAFVQWWRDQQPQAETPAGEQAAGEKVIRGRRSPASVGSIPRSRPKSS